MKMTLKTIGACLAACALTTAVGAMDIDNYAKRMKGADLIQPQSDGVFYLPAGAARILKGGPDSDEIIQKGRGNSWYTKYVPSDGGIGCWQQIDEAPYWRLSVPRPGTYRVAVNYSLAMPRSDFEFSVGAASASFSLPTTNGWNNYLTRETAEITLPAGEHVARLQCAAFVRWILNLKDIRLVPVDDLNRLNGEAEKLAIKLRLDDDPNVRRSSELLKSLRKKIAESRSKTAGFDPAKAHEYDKIRLYDQQAETLSMLEQALKDAIAVDKDLRRRKLALSMKGEALVGKLNAAEESYQRHLTQAYPNRYFDPANPPLNDESFNEQAVVIEFAPEPPADASARRQAFAKRDTPEAVERLAKQFFAGLNRDAPELKSAWEHFDAGRYQEALNAYRDYFFAKLTNPKKFGIPPRTFDLSYMTANLYNPNPALLEAAMNDVAYVQGSPELLKAKLGEPGAINWAWVDESIKSKHPTNPLACAQFYSNVSTRLPGMEGEGFYPTLLYAYASSGERKYLDKWAVVADDWAVNRKRDIEACPYNLRNAVSLEVQSYKIFFALLRNIALRQPKIAADFPGNTLARIMVNTLDDYIPYSVRIRRANHANWGTMDNAYMVDFGIIFNEFKIGRWILREGWRMAQLDLIAKLTRDGGNMEASDPGHDGIDSGILGDWMLPNLLAYHDATGRPEWLDQTEIREFEDKLRVANRYLISLWRQNAYTYYYDDPRSDKAMTQAKALREAFHKSEQTPDNPGRPTGVPEVTDIGIIATEPEVAARTARLLDDEDLAAKVGNPQVTTEALPYIGFYMLRDSWDKDGQLLHTRDMPVPSSQAGEDNLGYLITGYDSADRLISASPVYVDGKTQNLHFGMTDPGGKTLWLTMARDAIVDNRFHRSGAFDFVEGRYDGVYTWNEGWARGVGPFSNNETGGNFGHERSLEYRKGLAKKEGREFAFDPIRDVKHIRHFFSIKGDGLYIVSDRIESEAEHEYSLFYELPTHLPVENFADRVRALKEAGHEMLQVRAQEQLLRTANPESPNVTLRHFSREPLTYASHVTPQATFVEKGEPILDQWRKQLDQGRVPASQIALKNRLSKACLHWKGKGDQAVVTLVSTRPAAIDPMLGDLRDLTELNGPNGVVGFAATTPSGKRVLFQTGPHKVNSLKLDNIEARAEALLLVDGKRGIGLGCESLKIDGKVLEAGSRDFEFILDKTQDTVLATPIYQPIKPVEIEPRVNAFHDKLAVSMSCPTPGVVIRYTLDGSEPDHNSKVCDGPLSLTESTLVKARAYRKGVTSTPWDASGNHVSAIVTARFDKRPLNPALTVKETKPGLAYEYIEDLWPKLLADGERLPAKKTGGVKKLFDISMKETDGPFGVRYNGYLDIPADGAYTFHPPAELYDIDKDAGYDLRLFIDGAEWFPAPRNHAQHAWSVPLAKGLHAFKLIFTDFRRAKPKEEYRMGFPKPGATWDGVIPDLKVSGPGLKIQPITQMNFFR